ncbi:MAG: hypothetical protein K0Q76_3462 [Panacagrimonas sp.]|jgi:uncharacterized iron-regulated membrane protein|nr:PepSY domain-containing protein [Panacagrimonas sp.]MCC2658354.1 hypothetical protein [Panacagrimonas sp.]
MSGSASGGRVYRRFWRWHFYAAFLVIPFVLMQSTTGTLYLWHEEWADWAHPELRFVAPGDAPAGLDAQVAAARASQPQAHATTLRVSADPRRSTQVIFGGHHGDGGDGLPFPVFVDPYRAQVLGAIPAWQWMPGWSRKIHGGWPLGDAGSWLLELGACWAVVMILTGLWLWWPRDGRGLLASLLPRTHQGRRVFMRDLHAGVAVLFSLVILAFLVTALPWTKFWGEQVLRPVQNALDQPSPFSRAARARSVPLPGVTPAGLDEAVALARAQGVTGELEIRLDVPDEIDAATSMHSLAPRASQETAIAIDRYSRRTLVRTTWDDYPPIPRAVATGVDLHEGTFFGRSNQWLNTAVSACLVWLSVTGLLSWWWRRPRDGRAGLAAPARSPGPLPRAVLATGAVLCAVLPLLGLSVLTLWLIDGAWLRLHSSPQRQR